MLDGNTLRVPQRYIDGRTAIWLDSACRTIRGAVCSVR